MGNSQANAFREQFDSVELRESTKKQLWCLYYCTSNAGAMDISGGGEGGVSATKTVHGGEGADVASSSTAAGDHLEDSIRLEPNEKATIVMLQLNTQHPSYKASIAPPKSLNPDHKVPRANQLQYHMLETAFRALQWLRDHPHRALLHVRHVDYIPDERLLYATTPYTSIEPVLTRLPAMCATEILYGLTKVAEALAHLHSHGLSHRNVTWKSVFVGLAHAQKTDLTWFLGDPHFTSIGTSVMENDKEALKEYFAEIRGVRQDPTLLAYFPPEVNNPYTATHVDWSKMSCGAVDVFSFGVMIDQVLNTDRTRFTTTSSMYYNPMGNAFAQAKAKPALENLKQFAKLCQHEDPLKRPPIEQFFDCIAVQSSTYVQIQQQLDHHRSSGLIQKVNFFYLLHAELLKLPYELMVTRVMPRLLRLSIWSDPLAEPFLSQLLTVFRPSTTSTSDDGNDMLVVPLSDSDREVLRLPPANSETHLVPDEHSLGFSITDEAVTSLVPRLPCLGLLQPPEYQALVGTFLKKILQDILHHHHASNSNQFSRVYPSSLLILLLRHSESFLGAVSFSQVILPFVLPFLALCLRLPTPAVVMEALHAYSFVHKYVLSAYERLQQRKANGGASSESTQAHGGSLFLQSLEEEKEVTIGSLSAVVDKAKHVILDMMSNEIFSIACSDPVPDLRLTALTISVRTLAVPPNRRWKVMPKQKSLAALCINIMCGPVPAGTHGSVVVDGRTIVAPSPLRDALYIPDTTTAAGGGKQHIAMYKIALRAIQFAEKVRTEFTPAELVQDIIPSLIVLYDRCHFALSRSSGDGGQRAQSAAGVVVADKGECKQESTSTISSSSSSSSAVTLLEALESASLKLLELIYTDLRDLPVKDRSGDPATVPSEEVAPTATSASADDEDEELLTSTEEGKSHLHYVIPRRAILVDEEGWCNVRDPVPLRSVQTDMELHGVRVRINEPPKTKRLETEGNVRRGSSSTVAVEEASSTIEEDTSGFLRLPVQMIRSLPTFSFLDVDHDYNLNGILKPDIVAAEIIAAATAATRVFVSNVRPHPLAVKLPSRRQPQFEAPPAGVVDMDPATKKEPRAHSGAHPRGGEVAVDDKRKLRRRAPIALDAFEDKIQSENISGADEQASLMPSVGVTPHQTPLPQEESPSSLDAGSSGVHEHGERVLNASSTASVPLPRESHHHYDPEPKSTATKNEGGKLVASNVLPSSGGPSAAIDASTIAEATTTATTTVTKPRSGSGMFGSNKSGPQAPAVPRRRKNTVTAASSSSTSASSTSGGGGGGGGAAEVTIREDDL